MELLLIFSSLTFIWAWVFKPEILGFKSDKIRTPEQKLRSQYLQQRRDRVLRILQLMIAERNERKVIQSYYLLRLIDGELHNSCLPRYKMN